MRFFFGVVLLLALVALGLGLYSALDGDFTPLLASIPGVIGLCVGLYAMVRSG